MALTVHQLALRLAKHIGVTAFDPGDAANTNPLQQAAMRAGDIDDVVACVNGALQELWGLTPRSMRVFFPESCPMVTTADVGIVNDPEVRIPLQEGWEESILLPLALQRLTTHPNFQPEAAKVEIARQAGVARQILKALEPERSPASLVTAFR